MRKLRFNRRLLLSSDGIVYESRAANSEGIFIVRSEPLKFLSLLGHPPPQKAVSRAIRKVAKRCIADEWAFISGHGRPTLSERTF